MSKLKVLIVSVIVTLLMVGIAVPVLASTRSTDSEEAVPTLTGVEPTSALESLMADLGDVQYCEFEEEDNSEILSMLSQEKHKVSGGFNGVWGLSDGLLQEPLGDLCGLYFVNNATDNTVASFYGMWKTDEGVASGLLKGKCSDGRFDGYWYMPKHSVGGLIKGTCAPIISEASELSIARTFDGKWCTRSGKELGYLEGTWSPTVSSSIVGRIQGEWGHGSERPADGTLRGIHGKIMLADRSTIAYFAGKWTSNNEIALGRIGGLAMDGKFYGIWGGQNGGHGYLSGDYANHEFDGDWGYLGHGDTGKIWGKYGPFEVNSVAVDEKLVSVQKQLVAVKI